MMNNPALYEINTRVWLRNFDSEGNKATLKDVPISYWEALKKLGMDYVWLMGIWQTNKETVPKYCFEDFLIREYQTALKDWKREDVIGSPYSIDFYEVNDSVGTEKELIELKKYLNSIGIKLILDFVPNHFSANSRLIKEQPNLFLQANEKYHSSDPYTYFKPEGSEYIFAHGRDPFFPAWQDTIQVNYFCEEARKFMSDILVNLTNYCDGVRCDMAMLALNNVFDNTWGAILDDGKCNTPSTEFWQMAIEKVNKHNGDFIFIAEAYWNLEWDLQQLGFDYTYDKTLTDRLIEGYVPQIAAHLLAESNYQNHSLRFLENHDETRAIKSLGKEKSKAAAVIISTLNGMRFYNDGQFQAKKVKIPVQLGREPEEKIDSEVYDFYTNLLSITKDKIFKIGVWRLLRPIAAWEGNYSYKNILAWEWRLENQRRIVIINYANQTSQCRLKIDVEGQSEEFKIFDLLSGEKYIRSAEEIYGLGIYIELKNYKSHIFCY
ncbi:MAG: glycosidase [Melioribacteraceae bacterium]|nr:glycosidase [Melioribacteraceae bacterium]MCF8262942.1 glycosidase [Melioribacteraceae bacterium]MCF8430625.1 glycosidase [Melioribacteraceae bacterium]